MRRTAGLTALRALRWLPLLGALLVLRRLAALVETPLGGVLIVLPWRLDALTLLFMLAIAAGIALVPLAPRRTLVALGLACVLAPALLLEHLLALPAALLLTALVLRSRRWLAAALLLSAALAVPYLMAGAGWNDPAVALAFGAPVTVLLAAAAVAGLVPWRPTREGDPLELALRPLWLLPLLRGIGLAPWRSELGLLILGAGCAAALWSAAVALRAGKGRHAAATTCWPAIALAASGLLTTSGVVAALYCMLAYPLLLGQLLRSPRLAAPLPLTAAFVAAWMASGAVASSGAWLAGAALLLAALGYAYAVLLPGVARRATWGDALLLAASWALGIGAAPVVEQLLVPAAGLLQGGLTPFGLIQSWPWIGLAVLDAGQRRVTTLPALAVLLLALVPAAGVWLVARWVGGSPAQASSAGAGPPATEHANPVERLGRQVWWLGKRGSG